MSEDGLSWSLDVAALTDPEAQVDGWWRPELPIVSVSTTGPIVWTITYVLSRGP